MEFSEGSDVWAFGVTAWEIFSLGQTPYKGMAFSHKFTQFLQAGNRLPKPDLASDEMSVAKQVQKLGLDHEATFDSFYLNLDMTFC